MASLGMLSIVLALICFMLAAIGVQSPKLNLGWLGLFFFALAGLLR